MARISALLFLLVFCSATAMRAQAPAPKPDPEVRKLHVWVGHWTYEEQDMPGPWGPGGKVSGEYNGQMILAGFFFQGQWKERGATGEAEALVIDGYSPVSEGFTSNVYWDDGTILTGTVSLRGRTFDWVGKGLIAGKQYLLKGQIILAPDLMSFTETFEISSDGRTWAPFSEAKYTKTKPIPKR